MEGAFEGIIVGTSLGLFVGVPEGKSEGAWVGGGETHSPLAHESPSSHSAQTSSQNSPRETVGVFGSQMQTLSSHTYPTPQTSHSPAHDSRCPKVRVVSGQSQKPSIHSNGDSHSSHLSAHDSERDLIKMRAHDSVGAIDGVVVGNELEGEPLGLDVTGETEGCKNSFGDWVGIERQANPIPPH